MSFYMYVLVMAGVTWLIRVIPLVLMCLLCILVPSMISQTSILLIPSGALALGIGFLLFKKGKL